MRPDFIVSKTAPSKTITCLFLACITFAAFSGALDNLFVNWDDTGFVHDNLATHSLNIQSLKRIFFGFYVANWVPLTLLSHAIDYRLYNIHPAGHHLTSVLLHVGNTVWVFLLFGALVSLPPPSSPPIKGGEKKDEFQPRDSGSIVRRENDTRFSVWAGGVFAALLFGLHPLRVESVAWVAERKDVLCAFFILPTYLAYLHYASADDWRLRKRWYLVALGCFALALMSKPMAVTAPAVFLLLDVFPLKRWQNCASLKRLLPEKIPFFILSVLCGILAVLAQRKYGAVIPFELLSGWSRLLNVVKSVVLYLVKTVLPTGLVPYYPFTGDLSVFRVWFFPSVFLLAGITVFCIFKWRKDERIWLAAWLYYLITLSPVSGIVHVGGQAAADRYTYLPTLGFFLLVGAGTLRAMENVRAGNIGKQISRLCVSGAAILAAFALLTAHQIERWSDSQVFWQYVIKIYAAKVPHAYNNLGQILMRVNQLDEAEAEFKTALASVPDFAPALNNLGLVYYEKNRLGEAEEQFRRVLKINPKYVEAHNNLGLVYFKKNRLKEAEAEYKAAFALQPESFLALNNLGVLYFEQGKMAEAEKMYKTALRIKPDYSFVLNNLGELYYRKGLLDEAEKEFKKSLEFDLAQPQAYNNLGKIYLDQDKLAEAESMFKSALQLNPKYANVYDNLGMVYRKKGLLMEAGESFKKALEIAPGHKSARQNIGDIIGMPMERLAR